MPFSASSGPNDGQGEIRRLGAVRFVVRVGISAFVIAAVVFMVSFVFWGRPAGLSWREVAFDDALMASAATVITLFAAMIPIVRYWAKKK